MEAARLRDENSAPMSPAASPGSAAELPAAFGEAPTPTEVRGVRIDEALLCSRTGEVLYEWNCESIEERLQLFKKLEEEAKEASKDTTSGPLHRVLEDNGQGRLVVQIQPNFKLLVRSALPKTPAVNNK